MPLRISKNRVALSGIPLELAQSASIASAATVNLATATGNEVHITGSTGPITSFGTVPAGTTFTLIFDSTPTLTYNATSLILNTGTSDYTCAAGDRAIAVSEGSGNWVVTLFKKNGVAAGDVVTAETNSVTGGLTFLLNSQDITSEMGGVASSPSSLTMSFRVPTRHRVWQGVCWWGNRFIATSDRDASFAISNTISVYSITGKLVSELTNAYAGTDPGGKKMSFGSPFVQGDLLYMTAYNFNDGGSPLISRVLRFTLNPATGAVALDTSFGTSGVQSIGSDTAEQVAWVNGEWWVCYYDQQYIRRFNTSWVSQGTVTLSQAFPINGGSQSMIWEDADATVYIIMHGPNTFASERSSEIHKYTRSGTTLTYVSTLQSPGFGLTQGASAGPLGYCWADRPGDRIWVTPDLIETPMRAHCPPSGWPDLFEPTLVNGWVNYDAVYDRTAKAYFDQQTGRVYLEGIIKSGTITNGTKLFNLPSYMRPKYSTSFAVVSNELFGAIGVVGTSSGSGTPGDVIIRAGSATWLTLDGVSWLAGN